MKLYRDLTEGETLQPGDLYRLRHSDMDWCEYTSEEAELTPDATVGLIGADDLEWIRPIDPREQYDKVSLQLAQERVEHGWTKEAGLSDEEIRQAFWAEMKPSWDEATQ